MREDSDAATGVSAVGSPDLRGDFHYSHVLSVRPLAH